MKTIILLSLLISALYSEGLFSMGSKNINVTVGADNSFGNNYTVLGTNVNYFVVDNLSLGASYEAFIGADPKINQVTVPVTYHIPFEGITYRPYVGAFYNQTFIDAPYEDYNIYGGRVGVSLKTSLNSFLSFGWVQELGTSSKEIKKKGYPEVTAGFSF